MQPFVIEESHTNIFDLVIASHCRNVPDVGQPPWIAQTFCQVGTGLEKGITQSSSDFGEIIGGDEIEGTLALNTGADAQCGQEEYVVNSQNIRNGF